MLVTLFIILLVAIVALALVATGPVAQAVGDVIGLGSTAITVWNIANWPVLLLVVILIFAVLYHLSPNVKLPGFRWALLPYLWSSVRREKYLQIKHFCALTPFRALMWPGFHPERMFAGFRAPAEAPVARNPA